MSAVLRFSDLPDPRAVLLAFDAIRVGLAIIDGHGAKPIYLEAGADDDGDGDFVTGAGIAIESMQLEKETLHEFIGRRKVRTRS